VRNLASESGLPSSLLQNERDLVILSAAGAKDLLWAPHGHQQILRSRASRALAQDDSARRFGEKKSDGGRASERGPSLQLFPRASGPVILSAAGAKDLLVERRRREDLLCAKDLP